MMNRILNSISGGVALYFIAILVQLVWGLVPSASKLVIAHVPIMLYIALRWTIAGSIFLGVALSRRQPMQWRNLPRLAVLGFVAYGCSSLGTLYGLEWGGVVNFGLASAVNPLLVAAASIVFLGERPSRGFGVALAFCMAGLLLLAKVEMSASESVVPISLIVIVAGYACEGLAFVFSKRLRESHSLPQYLAALQLSAAAFMWGICAAQGESWPVEAPREAWLALIFVAVVACVVCYGVWYWLLRHVPGHHLALFDTVHVLSAVTFGILFFAEALTPWTVAGGALLLVGLIAVVGSARPPAEELADLPGR